MIALICALALGAVQQDPVEVSAALTATRIEVGGTTMLQVTVQTRGETPDDIRIPPLPPQLEMLGSSEFTQMQLSMPGGRSRITRREILLRARGAGILRIDPITVVIGSRTYRTRPVELVVSRGGGAGGGADAAPSRSHLEVLLDPDTVYVGEQVLLRARVTFSEDMRLRQSRPPTFEPPAPSGFWIQEIPDPVSITLRVADGRSVETQTFRRAYFPLSAGEFRLPPARLHYEVRRGFLYAPENRELVSDSARLVVLPVPEEGRPASYTGAVGRFRMEADLSPARTAVGEPAVLTVSLAGTGNVKALPAPRLPELPGAELFAPSQESRVEVVDDEVGGVKRFSWMIVPQRPGTLVVPPIDYAVFDPELRAFVVLRSDTLRLTAAPVAAALEDAGAVVRGLRTAPGAAPLQWTRTPVFAAMQILPLLLLVAVVALRRRRARGPSARQRAREARAELAALRRSGTADAAALEHTLTAGVLRITGAGHRDAVRALLDAGQPQSADRLERLLAELRRVRYAPDAAFAADTLFDEADTLLRDSAPRSRRYRRAAGAAVLLAGSLLPVLHAQPDPFARGVAAYHDGEFTTAARAFHDHARTHPTDINAWYNVGLASYRAQDPGRAAWAWLRAVRLAPRDADITHNLRVLGAGEAVAAIRPPDRLAGTERALGAALGWWVGLAGLAALVLGRARRLATTATAAGTLLLLYAAVTTAMLLTRPLHVVPLRDGATLHAAPDLREPAVQQIGPGTAVAVMERREDWLRVRAGEREGWVERRAVAAP